MAIFDSKAKAINGYQKSIDEKNGFISRYYDEMGRLYYSQYMDLNTDNTKDINTRCEAITRLYQEIEGLNHKILYEKGLKLCLNCRTENRLEYTFCYKCGNRFTDDNADPIQPAVEEATPVEEKAEESKEVEEAKEEVVATEEPAEEKSEDKSEE